MKMFFPLRRWPRSHSRSKVTAHHWERGRQRSPETSASTAVGVFSDFLKRTYAPCKKWSTHFLGFNMHFVEKKNNKKQKTRALIDYLIEQASVVLPIAEHVLFKIHHADFISPQTAQWNVITHLQLSCITTQQVTLTLTDRNEWKLYDNCTACSWRVSKKEQLVPPWSKAGKPFSLFEHFAETCKHRIRNNNWKRFIKNMSHTLQLSDRMRLTFLQTTDRLILLMSEVFTMCHFDISTKKKAYHVNVTCLCLEVEKTVVDLQVTRQQTGAWLRFNISVTPCVEAKTCYLNGEVGTCPAVFVIIIK